MESCQIYFITKLKYNLRKLNTERPVWSPLVINCCNISVECLHGCCIKKTFSHGYFKSGNYRTCLIEKRYVKFSIYTGIWWIWNPKSFIFLWQYIMMSHYVLRNISIWHCNPSPFTPFEPPPPPKKIYQICFLVTMKKIIHLKRTNGDFYDYIGRMKSHSYSVTRHDS